MFLNLFSFCFDEIEHQLTLEELQNLSALFQVGIDQVSCLNIHLGNLILFDSWFFNEKYNPFNSYKIAVKNKFALIVIF